MSGVQQRFASTERKLSSAPCPLRRKHGRCCVKLSGHSSAAMRSGIIAFVSDFCDSIIKEARCTYVLTPYRSLANRSAPSV